MNSSKRSKKNESKTSNYKWTYPDTPPGMMHSPQRQPDPFSRHPQGQKSSVENRLNEHQRLRKTTSPAPPSSTSSTSSALSKSQIKRDRPQQTNIAPSKPLKPERKPGPAKAASKKKANKKKANSPSLLGIQDNTPSTRKQLRSRSKLNPEQLEIERRSKERYMFYLKKKRERFFRVLIRRFVLLVIIFTMMATSASALFLIYLYRTDRTPKPPDVTYKIGSENAKLCSYTQAYSRDVLLVNFFDIADLCGMTISGSAHELKFSLKDENGEVREYARFFSGSNLAVINGQSLHLSAPTRLISEELWIPADFLTNAMRGLAVAVSEDGKRLEVNRIELNSSTPSNPKYETISFLYKEPYVINPIDESQVIGLEAVEFLTDLSTYETYMNPAIRDDYLLLVNSNNKLANTYVPPDLTDVAGTETATSAAKQLREYAAKSLEALLIEAEANGIKNLRVSSAYRSYANQNYLFNYYINNTMTEKGISYEAAYKEVIAYSAPAGASEHQTGLAIDITSQLTLNQSFAQTEQYKWLSQNAHKFGFILRYPENKQEITNIMFEPWHYRYVGRYHATRIYESGLCLEEYLETLQK
ncbi:MAG: M15 family metallopeptidase [Clostridiales bacterium]|nr:M15 family metallopeptidase [Clostridiales bacterium]